MAEAIPSVSLIISAYNEEQVIEKKLQNALALEYPDLKILVVSDCSTDRTDELVQRYADQGVTLCRLPERGGKTAGLNYAVPRAQGEILVFSDANAIYTPDAIAKLVRHFTDASVGYVTGNAQYLQSDVAAGENESLYWRYEQWMKLLETRCGGMVGADGAIYAVRRELFQPLQSSDINDFVNPLQVVAQGYRGIYEPEAVCWEHSAGSFNGEFRRKSRIVSRSLKGLWRVRQLLNPIRYRSFTFKLVSHKFLRWFIPIPLCLLFLSNGWLATTSLVFRILFLLQVIFYLFALSGLVLSRQRRHPGFLYVPYYFCLINVAALFGVFRALRGQAPVVWNPER